MIGTTKSRLAGAMLVAMAAIGWTADASAQDIPASPSAPSPPSPPSKQQDIEDVDLDKLLDVKLEEKLGTTAAVSRRTESVLRAPAAITTLDADRIRLSGATTVVELLRWVPGVQVVRSAPGNSVVSLRGAGGLAGNDLVVLLDGMVMNSPLDGSVSWDLFPINVADIDRIEVVRGPVSTIYGPNAYTGVINIVTRDAGFSPLAVAVRGQAGLDTYGRGVGSTGGRIAHAGERLRMSWYWNTRYDGTNARAASGATQPDWAAIGTAGRLGYQVTKDGHLSVEVAVARSRRSELDHLAAQSSLQSRSQMMAIAKYEHTGLFNGHAGLGVWARTNVQRTDEAGGGGGGGGNLQGFTYAGTRARRSEAGLDLSVKGTRWLTINTGANVFGEYVDAPYINPVDNARIRPGYGFYGGTTLTPLRSLDLSVAARVDAPPTLTTLEASYRASAVLHSDTTAVRLSAGSSYRAPSWVEVAGRFVDPRTGLILLEGTPTITEPRNDTVELGVVWGPSVNFHLTPTVYASRLTQVIVQDFTPLVRKTFRNDPSDRVVLGGELEATWRVRENVLLHGWGGVLGFPDAPTSVATIGVPGQNSAFTGGARVQSTLLSERVGWALGVRSFSSRSYSVRAGIPPQIRAVDVPNAVAFEGMVEYRAFRSEPLWSSIRLQSSLPHGIVESPLPGAAGMGTVLIFGLEYRRE